MTDLKKAAQERYEEVEADLVDLARWLYENPEIALEEHHSSQRLAGMLEEYGFEVERPAYGMETAFVARAGASGPELIICCEYDALPEVGHACGHNLIAAAAVGAGYALAGMVDELGCRVTVLGTPAEEKHGGKVDLIQAGAFEGAAAAMMVHPGTEDVVDPVVLAVTHIDIDFYGHEAHASGAPQQGINALDAAVQAYNNVSMLRQALFARDRVHGVITYGGGAPNVIPAHTSMSWYVRAETVERLDVVYPKVLACFEAAAAATGCELNVRESGHRNIDLISNPVLVDAYLENTNALGRPMGRGKDQPIEQSGSTDMGNVSYEVPSIHPMLDIHTGGPKNHEKEFAAHTLSEHGTAAIRDGALGMAWTTIDVATQGLWSRLQ